LRHSLFLPNSPGQPRPSCGSLCLEATNLAKYFGGRYPHGESQVPSIPHRAKDWSGRIRSRAIRGRRTGRLPDSPVEKIPVAPEVSQKVPLASVAVSDPSHSLLLSLLLANQFTYESDIPTRVERAREANPLKSKNSGRCNSRGLKKAKTLTAFIPDFHKTSIRGYLR
jgi:hypothetical protein